jgi:hypothetical protein
VCAERSTDCEAVSTGCLLDSAAFHETYSGADSDPYGNADRLAELGAIGTTEPGICLFCGPNIYSH